MRLRFWLPLLLTALLGGSAGAQPAPPVDAPAGSAWDPVKSATGWASFDRDGSCVFFDPVGRRLLVWSRETGVSDLLDLSRLRGQPDKWVLDPAGNAWVVAGTNLQRVDRDGRLGPGFTLPAEVADLAWDARSFLLCFRSREAYLERRDLNTGSLIWAAGPRPAKDEGETADRHHVAIPEDGRILLSTGDGFQLMVLDPAKGDWRETVNFKLKGERPPALVLGGGGRGALAWWLDHNVAVAAIPAAQLPGRGLTGMVLAKMDLGSHELTLLPTDADARSLLVGVLDGSAVLRLPQGGLGFFPIP